MENSQSRRDKLRKRLKKDDLGAMLVTNFANVTYLTGFTGDDSLLLLTGDYEVLLTDPRYTEQVEQECPGLEMVVRRPGVSMTELLAKTIAKFKLSRLAIEGDSMTVSLRDAMEKKVSKTSLSTTSGLIEQLRAIKDRGEIAEIREAIRFAEQAFATLQQGIRRDQTEKQVADTLEHEMRLAGAKCAAFPPIIAVGPRAALPHARPTSKRLDESGFMLVDWGASGPLYKSDLTRMLVTAKISPKLERVYGVVLKAQLSAIEAIRPGISCQDVDRVARGIIEAAGFGKHFGHGLGHGIGLDIHEAPRLGRGQTRLLEAGMVITVEPGIYLSGFGGVRIEDDVLVTKRGHEVLTSVPKQWQDCFIK